MSTVAVIGTFFKRPWAVPYIARALREQTRPPDHYYFLCETEGDLRALSGEEWPGFGVIRFCPVPDGVVPPSYQINRVLGLVIADYVMYLTDDSLPYPHKIERMAGALDDHPEWGSVYCSQTYGTAAAPDSWGALALKPLPGTRHASGEMPDPFCRVDHTQIMHRRSEDRWPEGMEDIRWSDGRFFQSLVNRFGPMQPVPEVLDWTCQMPDGISSR